MRKDKIENLFKFQPEIFLARIWKRKSFGTAGKTWLILEK